MIATDVNVLLMLPIRCRMFGVTLRPVSTSASPDAPVQRSRPSRTDEYVPYIPASWIASSVSRSSARSSPAGAGGGPFAPGAADTVGAAVTSRSVVPSAVPTRRLIRTACPPRS